MTSSLGYQPTTLDARGAADTAREIAQQPDLWRRIAAAGRDGESLDLPAILGRGDVRVVLAGAGTSAFAGQVLAPALRRALRRRIDAVATTDLVASPHDHLDEDVPTVLVSFARSGDSPESTAATELADALLTRCWHVVVTCNPEGRLARAHTERPDAEVLVLPAEANDRGFAMTSSFTGMLLTAARRLTGAPDGATVERLAAAAERLLDAHGGDVQELAGRRPHRIVYLGSGALAGLAAESALKTLELTAGGVVGLSDSPLGFRHGPKSVLDERTVVVVYLSNDPHTRRYDLDMVAELARSLPDGHLITIGAGGDRAGAGVRAWDLPGLHDVPDAALALPAVVGAQATALALSLAEGRTPDNPFPSGEVNRVVQGVVIHPLPR